MPVTLAAATLSLSLSLTPLVTTPQANKTSDAASSEAVKKKKKCVTPFQTSRG